MKTSNYKPMLVVDQYNFKNDVISKGMQAAYDFYVSLWKKMQEVCDYQWDNTKIYVSCDHTLVTIQSYNNVLTVWDMSGCMSLGHVSFNDNDTKTALTLFGKILNNFNDGIINCNGCGKEIKKSEIAGNYFAGHYCSNCWESKYKAIEAQESYN